MAASKIRKTYMEVSFPGEMHPHIYMTDHNCQKAPNKKRSKTKVLNTLHAHTNYRIFDRKNTKEKSR
jgi:hypothetical protein